MANEVPKAFDSHAAGMVSRRHLPHWRQDGAIYFVTFRLADSLPQERLEELHALVESHRRTGFQPVRQSNDRLEACPTRDAGDRLEACPTAFIRRVDEWLHAEHGNCCLAEPGAGGIVQNALLFFDAQRYRLGSYVVMPNHVHALVMPMEGHELSRILHSWKSFTANEINKALGRCGPLWQDESFDHIVRGEEALANFAEYVEHNADGAGGKARPGRGSL